MSNILETYYRGISQQLRAEVDFINTIFTHQGVKGDGNESILRDLLKKFIPKKYGIGTGIIIDRKGNQSKQIDIIVYDQLLYPSILAVSTLHMFPVDIVYATIEVKTTLTSTDAQRSIANIASVRSLDLIPDHFQITKNSSKGLEMRSCAPTPPLGAVFAYNSDAEKFETFKQWFVPQKNQDHTKHPSIIGCLDQGLIFHDAYGNQPTKGCAIPLHFGNGKTIVIEDTNRKYITHDGVIYPIKGISGKRIVIDHSRVLLLFIVSFSELLEFQFINPSIKFSEHYYDPYTTFRIEV